MARGGYRAGAGRPKGSTKAQKIAKTEEMMTNGVGAGTKTFADAMAFAMDLINDQKQPMELKVRLAIALMPFQHLRMAETTPTKKQQRADVAKKASQGRYAVPPAPSTARDEEEDPDDIGNLLN